MNIDRTETEHIKCVRYMEEVRYRSDKIVRDMKSKQDDDKAKSSSSIEQALAFLEVNPQGMNIFVGSLCLFLFLLLVAY